MKYIAVIIFFGILFTTASYSCSVMFLCRDNLKIIGRNQDWNANNGSIKLHKKGVKKTTSLWGPAKKQKLIPATWTSKYNNIAFHSEMKQKGISIPIGGMNSKSLVICQLYVNDDDTTNLAFQKTKTAIMASRWVGYCLDNYKSVDEIISNITKLKVINNFHAHWFAADSSGNSAIFETINGNLVVSYGQPLVPPCLTNHTYETSCSELKQYKDFGGNKNIPDGHKSMERFVRGAYLLKKYKNEPPIKYMFSLMHKVRRPANVDTPTKWSTVYDLKNKIIYYRKLHDNKYRKIIFMEAEKKPNNTVLGEINIK
ncbi:MAG TPA: linear amide C-N hydrolase [Victivallales bacterium]|nr:linear amide C-N hydrolase [Victivallales bacterium]